MIRLHPSEIHFSHNNLSPDEISPMPSTALTLPKLQVFKKHNCFFALDNNVLRLYRDFEAGGGCGLVDVELVPQKVIPSAVLLAATACSDRPNAEVGTSGRQNADARDSGASTMSIYSTESEEQSECDESDDDYRDDADDLTCLVCKKKFRNFPDFTFHQINKKHFGCYACGEVFSSSKDLNQHKDTAQHFSDVEDSE